MFEPIQSPSFRPFGNCENYSDIYDEASDRVEKFVIERETKKGIQNIKETKNDYADKENIKTSANHISLSNSASDAGVFKSNLSAINRRHTTNDFFCNPKAIQKESLLKQDVSNAIRSKSDANELLKAFPRIRSESEVLSKPKEEIPSKDILSSVSHKQSPIPIQRKSSSKTLYIIVALILLSGSLLFISKLTPSSSLNQETNVPSSDDPSYTVDIKLESKAYKNNNSQGAMDSKRSDEDGVDYRKIANEIYKMIFNLIELNDKISEEKIIASIRDKHGEKYFESIWPYVLRLKEKNRDIIVNRNEETGENIWKLKL